MISISVVVLSTALLLAMVLNLSLKPFYSTKLMTGCLVISVIGGLIIYGIGFAEVTGNITLSIARTVISVFRMFVGINEYSAIAGSSFVSTTLGLIIFWVIHLLAFYSMASAVMFTLGAEAVRYLRLLLSRKGDLVLIYGINENSIAIGKESLEKEKCSVVFVTENADRTVVEDLNNQGMSVVTGTAAISSEPKVLKYLGIKRRMLTVYALDEKEDSNLFYALRLKDSLENLSIDPQKTRLTLPGAEEILTHMLQVSDESYGFGYVHVYDECKLAARAVISTCPPWDYIHFDQEGKATEHFDCVIVGFGRHGQETLRQLIMNGQFAGSTFHAAVFSPKVEEESGYMYALSPELLKHYDIQEFSENVNSQAFYKYIGSRINTIKMIVVATGKDELNREISDNLMLYLNRKNAEQICVIQCGKNGARYQERIGSPIILTEIYTLDFLSAERSDRGGIVLNSYYDHSDKTDWDKWVSCDGFSKMSSRASADFVPAFIKASGYTADDVLAGKWDLSDAMIDSLGETEHLRWNAFHYVMGYSTMTYAEIRERIAEAKRLEAAGEPCNIRITKDAVARKHACLIPWDELDNLSQMETEETGKKVDYKKTDIGNVMAVPEILKAMQTGNRS